MRRFFKSEKAMILFAFIFAFLIALYNVYDFSVDKSDRYAYTSSEAESYQVELININTASVEELCKLPSIGTNTAQKIVDYREVNGNFESIEEIKEIKGIGDKDYIELMALITVE